MEKQYTYILASRHPGLFARVFSTLIPLFLTNLRCPQIQSACIEACMGEMSIDRPPRPDTQETQDTDDLSPENKDRSVAGSIDDDRDTLKRATHYIGLNEYHVPDWEPKDAFREAYQNWY